MVESIEDSAKNHDDPRVLWREVQQILKICGYEQQDYAKAITLTPSGLSQNIWKSGDRYISLQRMDVLRELVGERNFNLAREVIRREKEKEVQSISRIRGEKE